MSKIALSGNASGTGTLTIAAPNTNSDYTLTLPAEAGTVLTSGGAIDVNSNAPADSVVINSSGNVGIGTSSPATSLCLGNGKVLGWLNSSGSLNGTTTGTQILKFSDNNLYIDNLDSSTNIIFRRNGPTESMRIDSSGNLLFNSGYGSVATAFGCRVWCKFTVSGGTPTLTGTGNVSSITDNAVGDFTVNFTTAMPNANYGYTICHEMTSAYNGGGNSAYPGGIAAGSIRIAVEDVDGSLVDYLSYSVQVFR
jgi:hypothetical protein